MEIFLDCLPCMLRQALEASRLTAADPAAQSRIMAAAMRLIPDYQQYRCSPDLVRSIHQMVREQTGNSDPYQLVKQKDIQTALHAVPQLQRFLEDQGNSLYWALKIAATGNILDSAIYSSVNLEAIMEKELYQEFTICDLDQYQNKLKSARNLLIIGDNAGEAVFDRLLISRLAPLPVTYAVRSQPTINDVTLADAQAAGLENCAQIVSSGCASPGLILADCSAEFRDIFNQADLVISKGQGNFEGLSEVRRDVFFLLKAKCPVIARAFGVKLGSYIFSCRRG